jgi:hypothetical protein
MAAVHSGHMLLDITVVHLGYMLLDITVVRVGHKLLDITVVHLGLRNDWVRLYPSHPRWVARWRRTQVAMAIAECCPSRSLTTPDTKLPEQILHCKRSSDHRYGIMKAKLKAQSLGCKRFEHHRREHILGICCRPFGPRAIGHYCRPFGPHVIGRYCRPCGPHAIGHYCRPFGPQK